MGVNGCKLIRTNSEINRPIMNRNTIKDTVKHKDLPYFYTTESEPLEFDLQFSLLEEEFTDKVLYELTSIFSKSSYVKFQSVDYLGVVFYVIATSIELITFGSHKGWINVHLENCCGHGFSEIQTITKDFSNLTTTQTFTIDAKFNSNMYYYPQLNIDLKGASTGFELRNLSDGNRLTGFSGLLVLESLEIDNEKKSIVSSTGNFRLDKMLNNHAWFRLVQNKNILSINKPCVLQLVCQYGLYI